MTSARMLLVAAIAAPFLQAQTDYLKAEGLAPANGYTHAVVVPPGKLAFVAGQVALDAQGKLVGKGDLKAQAEQVFLNLKTALAAAGSSFDNVVKITWYVKDYKPELLPILREVRNRYINSAKPPASTLLGVAALAQSDYLLEVEAIAVAPEKAAKAQTIPLGSDPWL